MTSLKLKLFFCIVVIAFTLNYYKPFEMFNDYMHNIQYKIFPWQEVGQKSSSSLIWLIFHVVTAVLHVVLSFLRFYPDYITNIKKYHMYSHVLFVLLIITNIEHFGEFDLKGALMFNGVPLLIAVVSFSMNDNVTIWDTIYFLAVTSPILFEFVLRTKQFAIDSYNFITIMVCIFNHNYC